jgi:hypothetical protein
VSTGGYPDDEDSVRPALDDELRRLFADDRLAVPVARNAGVAVVAGARRRRRNRVAMAAAGSVLAMAGVVFAGAALSGIGHQPATSITAAGPVLSTTAPVASTTTSITTSPSSVPPTAYKSVDVLGPFGYDKVSLGMSLKDVAAVAQLRDAAPVTTNGCLRYSVLVDVVSVPSTVRAAATVTPTTASLPADAVLELLVSARDGVIQVIAAPTLRTPEGIGIGSSKADLVEAYPMVVLPVRAGSTTVPAAGNPRAIYVFQVAGDGTVTSFALRQAKSDCPS